MALFVALVAYSFENCERLVKLLLVSGTKNMAAVLYKKNSIRNLKQLMRTIPMEGTKLDIRRNGEYRKTTAVGHNSKEQLLTNYFP